jgi:Ca2+-binding RTX toxin-like protein
MAIVNGGASNDTLVGTTGADTVNAFGGADTIDVGQGGSDLVYAGTGNDTVSAPNGGADTVYLEDGNDQYNFIGPGINTSWGSASGTYVDGGLGNDTIAIAVAIGGTATVLGGGGNDEILAGQGNLLLYGGDGNDTFDYTRNFQGGFDDIGTHTLDGGTGNDRLALWDPGIGSVTSNILFTSGDAGQFIYTGKQTGTFTSVESFSTANGADTINASLATINVTIDSRGGADTIQSGSGNDTILAGSGADSVVAGVGNDSIDGGTENDLLFGGLGDDTILGSAGVDTLDGGDGNDSLNGGIGSDSIVGGVGDDTIDGGTENDLLYGGLGTDSMLGSAGDDTLDGGDGNDILDGGTENDSVSGGIGDDALYGGAGVDAMYGGDGIDGLSGGDGNDLMFGGTGNDGLAGDLGDDTIYAEAGDDSIRAGDGNDQSYGGIGNDSIVGLEGNDLIDGGAGVDIVGGDTGNDTFAGSFQTGDVVVGGEDVGNGDTDILDLGALGTFGVDYTVTYGGGNNEAGTVTFLTGPSAGGTMSFSEIESLMGPPDYIVEGTSGDDTIDAGYVGDPEGDLIDNNDGNPGSPGVGNDDLVEAYGGNDLVLSGDGNDTVYGGDGVDDIATSVGNDLVYGGANDDLISTEEGEDTVYGDAGNDLIKDIVGNDQLYGGAGDDTIFALDNNDLVVGGDGVDQVEGGTGNDTFVGGFQTGDVVIGGEDVGNGDIDVLDLTSLGTLGVDYGIAYGGVSNENGSVFFFTGPSAGGTMTFAEIENVITSATPDYIVEGTSGNDTIDAGYTGDPEGDRIDNNDGNPGSPGVGNDDLVEAYGGNDSVQSGDGNDTVYGGDGNDDITTGVGNDLVYGGANDDVVSSEDGNDTVYGDDGDDTIKDSYGNDQIYGGAGNDTINAVENDDLIDGGAGVDYVEGGTGNDTFVGGFQTDDVVIGGEDIGDADIDILNLSGLGVAGVDYTITYGGGNNEAGTVNFLTGPSAGGLMTFSEIESVICFASGTKIKSWAGEVEVETLRVGSRVLTMDNGYRSIRWIGSRKLPKAELEANPHLYPIRIPAGALGMGLPETDLLVSPQHRVFIRSAVAERMMDQAEVLIAAKHFVGTSGIHVATDIDSVDYWHFLFDQHEIVWSNGAPTESLFTGPEALKSVSPDARVEIEAILPEIFQAGRVIECVPVRKIVQGRLGRKLAARHEANGKPYISYPLSSERPRNPA